jgi:hypothetical protein
MGIPTTLNAAGSIRNARLLADLTESRIVGSADVGRFWECRLFLKNLDSLTVFWRLMDCLSAIQLNKVNVAPNLRFIQRGIFSR